MKKEPGWKIKMHNAIAHLENARAKCKKYLGSSTVSEPIFDGYIDTVIKEIRATNGYSSFALEQIGKIDRYVELAKAVYDKHRKNPKEAP